MTLRTILTHVQSGAGAPPHLDSAVHLAAQFGAHLIGLGAEAIPPLGFTDPYGFSQGDLIVALRDSTVADVARAEAAFRAATSGVSHEWRSTLDMPARALVRAARAADLIVAAAHQLETHDPYRVAPPGELALLAGRPVLVAPPGGGPLSGEGVVVAWKDTRESRRALFDALPFLQRAKRVTVLAVCGKDGAEVAGLETADVVETLGRHGVKAEAKVSPGAEEAVRGRLIDEARAIDADLIVCGAYGHSRLQEWVLGGVTRDLLLSADRFVLFSH